MSKTTDPSVPKKKKKDSSTAEAISKASNEFIRSSRFDLGDASSSTSSAVTTSGNYYAPTTAVPSAAPPEDPFEDAEIVEAVLSHIHAIRALGRADINTQEIADALGVSVQEVNACLEKLKTHGVRRR